jgi:hypothetical protein
MACPLLILLLSPSIPRRRGTTIRSGCVSEWGPTVVTRMHNSRGWLASPVQSLPIRLCKPLPTLFVCLSLTSVCYLGYVSPARGGIRATDSRVEAIEDKVSGLERATTQLVEAIHSQSRPRGRPRSDGDARHRVASTHAFPFSLLPCCCTALPRPSRVRFRLRRTVYVYESLPHQLHPILLRETLMPNAM